MSFVPVNGLKIEIKPAPCRTHSKVIEYSNEADK